MNEPLLVTNHTGEILVFVAPRTAARAAADRINSHPIEHPIYPGVFSRFAKVAERPLSSATTHVYVTFPEIKAAADPPPARPTWFGCGLGDRVKAYRRGEPFFAGNITDVAVTPTSVTATIVADDGLKLVGVPMFDLVLADSRRHRWHSRDARGNAACVDCGGVMMHGAPEFCPGKVLA